MIVGNGLIANSLKTIDTEDTIFFASGVSNSLETRISEFEREKKLLLATIKENPTKTFIYFSTCSIYDSSKNNSPYVLHKLAMEQIISRSCEAYFIFRVSNVVGKGGNPNILVNYLVNAIRSQKTIAVHTKATRNLIDVADISAIVKEIIPKSKNNQIINLAYLENFTIIEIIKTISEVIKIQPQLELHAEGSGYEIEISKIESYFKSNRLTDKGEYLQRLILNYYL